MADATDSPRERERLQQIVRQVLDAKESSGDAYRKGGEAYALEAARRAIEEVYGTHPNRRAQENATKRKTA